MAAPNLNGSSLTVTAAVDEFITNTVSETSLTANASSSGHTYITLSLTAANTTTSGLSISVNWYDGTHNAYILKNAVVPGNAQIECCPTRKLLLEGWTVKVTTPDSTTGITFTHHYLDCH